MDEDASSRVFFREIHKLPGSVRAAEFCMEVLLPVLPHAVKTAKGEEH